MKRTLVFILVCAFLVALFPVSAFASSVSNPIGMSIVAPAWWAYITAVGAHYVADGLTSTKLGDFLSDTINGFIGENTLDALIGDGLSFDGGEFKLTASVSNLFRSWLSSLISDKNISSSPTSVVSSAPPLTTSLYYSQNYSNSHILGSDYGVITAPMTRTIHYINNNGFLTTLSLTGFFTKQLKNGSWVDYGATRVDGASYYQLYKSKQPIGNYSSPTAIFFFSASNQLVGYYSGNGMRDYSAINYTPTPILSLSTPSDFILPDEYTEPQTISSPLLDAVSEQDLENSVYNSTVSNEWVSTIETTVTRPIVDTIQGLFDAISDFWHELLDWIRSFWDNFVSSIDNAIDGLFEGIKGFFSREDSFIADFGDKLQGLSFSSIWHYVTAWLASISAFLSVVLSIWGNLPYSFSVIVWAGLALTIIFGVFRKFIK